MSDYRMEVAMPGGRVSRRDSTRTSRAIQRTIRRRRRRAPSTTSSTEQLYRPWVVCKNTLFSFFFLFFLNVLSLY